MGKLAKKNKNKTPLVKKVEDFKKVKSKVGRKLKKLNETLPNIKARKIILKNQFAERKANSELRQYKLNPNLEILSVSKINELHETIISTLRKSSSDKSSHSKDSLIVVCQLLKSISSNQKISGHDFYARSVADILEVISPLLVHPENDVRLKTVQLFKMVMGEPLMKRCSCRSHPIVSSNLFRALSNQACSDDAMLLVDILLEQNDLFVVSVSNKLINSILHSLGKQGCIKSQSSLDKVRSDLKMPNQLKLTRIRAIGRLSNIFKVLTNQLQLPEYLYYMGSFGDSILNDDKTCLVTMTTAINIIMLILRDILLPVPLHNYCFESLTCQLLQTCLTFLEIIFYFSSQVIRSTALLASFLRENVVKQFAELTTNFPLSISQKISKRGKWTGAEKDISASLNKSITQLNQFIEQFSDCRHQYCDMDLF